MGFAFIDTFMKDKAITIYSKESGNENDRPRLDIDGTSMLLTDDASVKDGLFSNKNFGKELLTVTEPWKSTSTTRGKGMEIDIMEALGGWKDNQVQHALHWDYTNEGDYPNRRKKEFEKKALSDGYHVYGMLWEPDSITFYIDGVKTEEYKGDSYTKNRKDYLTGGRIPTVASYILLSHQLGGWSNSGNKVPDNFSPATMSVDYVRVWEKEGAK